MQTIARFVAGLALAGLATAASPQEYPSKTIRMIVPFAAGGPTDVIARTVGQKLTESWGQPVVIDNRGGVGGNGAGLQAGIPWAAAGAAVGVVLTMLVLRGSGRPGMLPPEAPLAPIGAGAGDISQMTPQERAARLFNRVMRLNEERKADSVAFFLPMALQTYAMLPVQDADSRYHVGLLQLAGNNRTGALAQADSIHQVEPTHLFAFMLRALVAKDRNDAAVLRKAHADFRRHEREERARARPEYQDHAAQLDAFARDAARGDTGS